MPRVDDLALLREYEAVVRFTRGEHFLPMAVEPYIAACSLWLDDEETDRIGERERAEVTGCVRDVEHAHSADGGLAVLRGNLAEDGCVIKTAGVADDMGTGIGAGATRAVSITGAGGATGRAVATAALLRSAGVTVDDSGALSAVNPAWTIHEDGSLTI